MEHASVSAGSVSSCYDTNSRVDRAGEGVDCSGFVFEGAGFGAKMDANAEAGGKKKAVKRWSSVRSVGQLGRSNPEVDEYVCWGVAR